MKPVSLIYILLLFLPFCSVTGQIIPVKKYTSEEGLAGNHIKGIYQDRSGFIWITTTTGGLNKYDGFRFTHFDENKGIFSVVNDVWEDRPGHLLVAQNNGAVASIENDKVTEIISPNNTIINHFVRLKDNRLFLPTDHAGILEWKQNSMQPVNSSYNRNVNLLVPFGDSLLLVKEVDDNFVRLLTKELKPFSKTGPGDYISMFTDSRGRTWMSFLSGLKLLSRVQNKNKPIHFDDLPSGFNIPELIKAPVNLIFEDSKKSLWFCTPHKMIIVDSSGFYRILNQKNGIPVNMITCITEDMEQNIWMGTIDGLLKIQGKNDIRIYGQANGLISDNYLFQIPYGQNKIRLFGKTIEEINLATGKVLNLSKGRVLQAALYIPLDNNRMIGITPSGYMLHSQEGIRLLKLKLPSGLVPENCTEVRKGLYLFTTLDNKIILADSAGYSIDSASIRNKIMAMAKDKTGTIWAGTWGNGLFKLVIGENKKIIISDTISGRLPDIHIRALYTASDGSIWVGTRYKGVVRIQQVPDGYQFRNLYQKDGLVSNWIRCIAEDPHHNIWLGTAEGLEKIITEKNDYRIFNYGRISNINHMFNSISVLDDGSLVCTGFPSVVHLRDNRLDTSSAPPVFITGKKAGTKNSFLSESFIDGITNTLPYDDPQINFEFSSPRFINENQIYYSYRLSGGSNDSWSKPSVTHTVSYANLKPGNYQFQVRTIGWDNQPGAPAVYSFVVATPFWKTTWFILAISVLVTLIFYGIYHYRLKQILRMQKMRNAIATDLHDDIGSSLTNINILSLLSKRNIQSPEKANEFLSRISEESSRSSQALDDIIWSVNTTNDTLEQTAARMRRYAAEVFDAGSVHYEIGMDNRLTTAKIGMQHRRDLYLVFKESINNIYKHAAASNVRIHISMAEQKLFLQIEDDGKGFDIPGESHRNGLKNLQSRIANHKGKISIESRPGSGTTIKAEIPYQ